jgi:Arc/MetJ-type ribon-helix-helix transcriptional regulator
MAKKEAKDKPPKVKVHITIDEALVKWINNQIQARNFHNMSHAVEKAIYELMKNYTNGKT